MKQQKRILSIEIKRKYESDPSYLEQEGFEERLQQYQDGLFAYIGIYAEADVTTGSVVQTLRSGGLWGIEDDSDAAYLKEIEGEELAALRAELYQFGFSKRAVAKAVEGIA